MFNFAKSRKFFAVFLILGLVSSLGLSWLSNLTRPLAATTTANDIIPAYNDRFRFGTNLTWRNPDFTDSQLSDLAAAQGLNSLRVFLPENYFESWGYNIALPNMQHYQANGQTNLTATLSTPSRAHSKAPANTPDWQLAYYSPNNLYEPIWNADGSVNPNNFWANYVYQAVSTYKPYVKVWEIWNEPDFTGNWNATQNDWWNSPAKPGDLPRWNDSVFSYVHMLRVSYEVIKKVDPTALVATGGLGYESFLDSILRYSDNPADGTPGGAYPLTGGAYFDVMSYHYYPQYGVQNRANGQWNTNTDSDNAIDNFITLRNNFQALLTKRGYSGSPYPAKYFISTETGFSSQPLGSMAGGMDLLRNYQIKLLMQARINGLKQVHTFALNDLEADTTLSDAHSHMGFYYDLAGLASPSQAIRKAASFGIEAAARALDGAVYDPAATTALNLPAEARGAVFKAQDGQRLTLLWARTANNSEGSSFTLNLPATNGPTTYNWQTNSTQTLSPVNGQLQLVLSATPLMLKGDITLPVAAPGATATRSGVGGVRPTATSVPATSVPATATSVPATATSKPATATPIPPTATPKPITPTASATTTRSTANPQKLPVSRITASGSDAYSPVNNLLDGNTGNYWGISGKPASAWLQLDLGTSRQVSEVRYFVWGTGHAPSTKIQYSSDSTNWTTLPDANDIDTGLNWGWNSVKAGLVKGRYIRFLINNPGQSLWTLGYYAEIQILGL